VLSVLIVGEILGFPIPRDAGDYGDHGD